MTEGTLKRFDLALRACAQRFPSQRIGQIIVNAMTGEDGNQDIYYHQDLDICSALERYAKT